MIIMMCAAVLVEISIDTAVFCWIKERKNDILGASLECMRMYK